MAESKNPRRRLAAIVMADVVGYSKLMEADETGTLAALKERRKAILEPVVRGRGGRIVKVLGDGALMEFASAVNAVEAALELQAKMAEANKSVPEGRHIILRVGINLGDVVGEGSDIYGDGVNVAARLEARQSRAESVFRPRFMRNCEAKAIVPSRTWERSNSRTLPDPCVSTACE